MNIIDLDGKVFEWKPRGREYLFNSNSSGLHDKARDVLNNRFPTIRILEEVSIPVRRGKTLFLDFYIPMKRVAVEVHGSQHFSYSSMFHKTRADFMRQKRNDREKAEWCELNGINLIVLKFDEEKDWVNQI